MQIIKQRAPHAKSYPAHSGMIIRTEAMSGPVLRVNVIFSSQMDMTYSIRMFNADLILARLSPTADDNVVAVAVPHYPNGINNESELIRERGTSPNIISNALQ